MISSSPGCLAIWECTAIKKLTERQVHAQTSIETYTISVTGYRTTLRNKIKHFWQMEWDSDPPNKLHSVKPILANGAVPDIRKDFTKLSCVDCK